jgi:hypothetical protein
MKLHHALFAPIALDGADLHGRINTGAHGGAYGANDLKTPTDAQAQAGTYKMGRITVQGLRIAIEQPHGSIRTGKDAGGKEWSSRMAAHYGYFEGTRGADGDGIDCFVGPFPESETAFLINQRNKGGGFDEHKVMLGFMSERHARGAYLDSYERGWAGLQSMVPLSIPQLRWWIKHGNKRIALTAESLPLEASKPMTTKKIYWTDTQPDGVSYDQVLYELRRMDGPDGLLLDSVTMAEIMEDTDGVIALDALVVENAQLARMSERLRAIMDRSGGAVKVPAAQVSDPFRARGVTNIATVFELSDGQSVSIFFHNPDTAPNKLAPGDEMISWKWLLNKKDITIVVAPEKGQDLNPRLVAQRIMKLAEKNSPAFQKANAKRAERMGNIEAIRGRIAEKEATLNELVAQVEAARLEKDQRVIAAEDEATRRKAAFEAVYVALIDQESGWQRAQTGVDKKFYGLAQAGELSDGGRIITIAEGGGPFLSIFLGEEVAGSEMVPDNGNPERYAAVASRLNAKVEAFVAAKRAEVEAAAAPNPIALVDAAYQFANATDAFKVRVAGSIEETDYSEFASAKAMDMKAKELGAEIHWGMGAALDSVKSEEGEEGEEGEDEDDFDPEAEFDACPVWQEEAEEVVA